MWIPVKVKNESRLKEKGKECRYSCTIINQTSAVLFFPAKSSSVGRWHCHQLILTKGQPQHPEPIWNHHTKLKALPTFNLFQCISKPKLIGNHPNDKYSKYEEFSVEGSAQEIEVAM